MLTHTHTHTYKHVCAVVTHLLLRSMVLAEFKEVKDVCMPWFKVDGKSPRPFVPSLVHIACSVVKHSEHGNQPIGRPISLQIHTI